MSMFAGIERRISGAVDKVYAESVRVTFMRPGGLYDLDEADDFDPLDAAAIVDFAPVVITPQDLSQYDGAQPFMTGDKVHVSFDEAVFSPARIPRAGDKIETISRPSPSTFVVTRAEPDRLGRILCICEPGK